MMTLDPRLRGKSPRATQQHESSSPLSSPSSSESNKRSRTISDLNAAESDSLGQINERSRYDTDRAEPNAKRKTSPTSTVSSRPPPSAPSAHNSLDFQQMSNNIAKRAIVPVSPPASGRLEAFTKAEDDVLRQGVALYGPHWAQIAAYFWKAAPKNPRSRESLRQRYRKHLDKRPKDGRDAEHAQEKVAAPSAASQSGASGSAPSSSPASVLSAPHLPASRAATPHPDMPQAPTRTVMPGKPWPKEEERQLLYIALKHHKETDILAQVGAVFKDYRSAFPATTRSSEAVHIKYRQLLQSMPKKDGEVECEEGEIVEAEKQMETEHSEAVGDKGERGHRDMEVEQESTADLTMAEGEDVQRAAEGEAPHIPAAVSEEQAQEDNTSQSNPATAPTGQGQPAAAPRPEEAAPAPINPPPPSPRTPQGTLPAQPQGNKDVHPALPVLPAIDFDFDVDHLTYGLRFSRLPRNCELSIFSPTRYKLRSLTSDQQPLPGAAFVFHMLANGGTQGLVLPPGTKTQVVVVPAANDEEVEGAGGEEGGGGGGGGGAAVTRRYVAETHFESPADKFLVVFASPL